MSIVNYIIDLVLNSIWISLLVSTILFGVIYGYKKSKGKNFEHKIITFLFLYYIASLLYVTVYRDGLFMNATRKINFEPLEVLYQTFQNMLVVNPANAYFILLYNILGNIAWFMPLGYYLGYQCKRMNLWKVLGVSFLLSLGIETFQYIAYVGISDIDDLILNTFGGVLGFCVYKMIHKRSKINDN